MNCVTGPVVNVKKYLITEVKVTDTFSGFNCNVSLIYKMCSTYESSNILFSLILIYVPSWQPITLRFCCEDHHGNITT